MSHKKQLKQLANRAKAQGWRVERTKGDHLCWFSPDGGMVFSAFTPSDRRAHMNHLSMLKKYGFVDK